MKNVEIFVSDDMYPLQNIWQRYSCLFLLEEVAGYMSGKHAVVFDDDELFRVLFDRIFNSKDIQVESYESPCLYFCMQSSTHTCPVAAPCTDFLLTDQMMQDMTGLEFLRRAKQMQCKIPESRKAIISGNWTEEEFDEAKNLSSNVFHKSDAKKQISLWIEKTEY